MHWYLQWGMQWTQLEARCEHTHTVLCWFVSSFYIPWFLLTYLFISLFTSFFLFGSLSLYLSSYLSLFPPTFLALWIFSFVSLYNFEFPTSPSYSLILRLSSLLHFLSLSFVFLSCWASVLPSPSRNFWSHSNEIFNLNRNTLVKTLLWLRMPYGKENATNQSHDFIIFTRSSTKCITWKHNIEAVCVYLHGSCPKLLMTFRIKMVFTRAWRVFRIF